MAVNSMFISACTIIINLEVIHKLNSTLASKQLHHGGRLRQAAKDYGIDINQWLDLSTGVSPWHYPETYCTSDYWNQLPQDNDGLLEAAMGYYCSQAQVNWHCLATAGSQAAIQTLPRMISMQQSHFQTVLVPRIGYKEHQKAWQAQGFTIITYDCSPTVEQIAKADVLVVINPNNPLGCQLDSQIQLNWLEQIHQQGGLMVVDEAFIDCDPHADASLLQTTSAPYSSSLIVLRSIGKFFGLAGARVGFCFASPSNIEQLNLLLGPWQVNGPAREVVKRALLNTEWQTNQRKKLAQSSCELTQVLQRYFNRITVTPLFIRVETSTAPKIHHQLAEQAILVRLTDEKDALRFGLALDNIALTRLENALKKILSYSINR
ncbi:threonine-phosphate decarboxylase [Shewanella sp. TC10]|uniref:threonine-phosphate decarboxylase n=1 Tax=Shewanella sp. TC10 TaxID=1419739 RepID=UPI00129E2C95|nr:threonine-phosphate decarboxylase [Shewanella sp. TC10]